jgi:hypothetical protein
VKKLIPALAVLTLVLLTSCRSAPCDEPIPPPSLGPPRDPTKLEEAPHAKLVHLVSFEMGDVRETLTGYLVVKAPDRLRLHGMTETGQRAFDVAWVSERVLRLHRAPFLRDDRVLDEIARAAARVFLKRPSPHGTYETGERRIERDGITYFYGGPRAHLRWLEGEGFSACFMDWDEAPGFYAPGRIHYRDETGRHPYELRFKLLRAEALPAPAPDSLFEPP